MMALNKSGIELKPEISFITNLIKQLKNGKIRIPRFQRSYVWKPLQIIDLFDSIYNMYPIGSLLIWETAEPMTCMNQIGPIETPSVSPGESYGYLLDGQQRLTTLAIVLGGNLHNIRDKNYDIWRVFFDLETKTFLHLKPNEASQIKHFPLSGLTDTFKYLECCKNIFENAGDRAQDYVTAAGELSERITRTYSMPIVRINGTTLDEAVKIFSRLNSAGTKIADDEMVSALSFRQDKAGEDEFNLSEIISDIVASLEASNFRDMNRNLILRAILGEMGLDVYRTSWNTLIKDHRKELEKAAWQCKDNLEKAVAFLKSENVTSENLLPYTMQLVLLSIYFKYHREHEKEQALVTLKRWFWTTSFSGWFAFGNATTIRHAILDLEKIANGHNSGFKSIDMDEPVRPLPENFDFRGGRTRAFCLFLMSLVPRDIVQGDLRNEVSSHGYKSYPYVFRKSHLAGGHNSPENRILLGQNYYPNELDRDNAFSNYLTALPEDTRSEVLQSHGITQDAYQALLQGDCDRFLALRRDVLIRGEVQFMRSKHVVPPQQPDLKEESIPDREDD